MRVLDLFSGIGGFSLGLERAGMTTVAFCEIEPFPRRVLAKHWPGVPIHDDIKSLDGSQYRGAIDVLCGGFPCQPFSTAGKQEGAKHNSYLWPEMLRVVRESRPNWVIAENVAGLDSMDLERVVSDLEAVGYQVWPILIPACAVGLPHRRNRIWICGYSDSDSESGRTLDAEAPRLQRDGDDAGSLGGIHGLSQGLDSARARMSALGNAVAPGIPEQIGRAIMEAA